MASFEEIVNRQLCNINSTLDKIKLLHETKEKRDTDIVFITIPENAGLRSFSIGTTKINFRNGQITNPDGSIEQLQTKLDAFQLKWLHSLSIDTNQDIVMKLDGKPKRTITANFSTQIPYLTYYSLEITCTVATNIQVFACTNPAAVIGQFKVTTVNIMEQESINGDGTEAQTWDAVVNLKNNLNRIRKKLNDIIGGVAWTDTVTASLGTIWAKFNATTGHKHSGAVDDAPKIPVSSMEVDIATQAELNTHAALTTGTHGVGASTIESIAGSQAKVDTHAALTSTHGASGNILGKTTGDATYAPIAKGVTNGDSYDHNGGDGAQIDHVNLANKGTNTHATIDTHLAAAAPHSGHLKAATFSFTGNGTQNRAIAHGLGRAPVGGYTTDAVSPNTYFIYFSPIRMRADVDMSTGTIAAADATNVYVGINAAGAWGNSNGQACTVTVW